MIGGRRGHYTEIEMEVQGKTPPGDQRKGKMDAIPCRSETQGQIHE